MEGDEGDVPNTPDVATLLGMARGQVVTQSYGAATTEVNAFDIAIALGAPGSVIASMNAAASLHPPGTMGYNAAAASALLAAMGIRQAPVSPPIDEHQKQTPPPRDQPPRYQRDEILQNFVTEEVDLSASPNTSAFTAAGIAAIAGARAQGYQVDFAIAYAIQGAVNAGQNISLYSGTLAATFGVNGPIGTTQGNIYAGRGGGDDPSDGGPSPDGPGQSSPGDPGQSP